jgi:hypothetical protein
VPGAPANPGAWSTSGRSVSRSATGDHARLPSEAKQQVSGREPSFGHPQVEFFSPHAQGQDYTFVTVFGKRRHSAPS